MVFSDIIFKAMLMLVSVKWSFRGITSEIFTFTIVTYPTLINIDVTIDVRY
jgi:hypothetical protein